jgi:Uma2 family endonuclease
MSRAGQRGMIPTMSAAVKPKLGYDDLWALGEDCRYELIGGEIVPKFGEAMTVAELERTAAPRRAHASGTFRLAKALARFAGPPSSEQPGGWELFSELHVIYGPHEIYCHDLAGYYLERSPAEPGWTSVRPNWACEVPSPGHEHRDLVDKFATLQRAGVEHYWIANVEAKSLQVYRFTEQG